MESNNILNISYQIKEKPNTSSSQRQRHSAESSRVKLPVTSDQNKEDQEQNPPLDKDEALVPYMPYKIHAAPQKDGKVVYTVTAIQDQKFLNIEKVFDQMKITVTRPSFFKCINIYVVVISSVAVIALAFIFKQSMILLIAPLVILIQAYFTFHYATPIDVTTTAPNGKVSNCGNVLGGKNLRNTEWLKLFFEPEDQTKLRAVKFTGLDDAYDTTPRALYGTKERESDWHARIKNYCSNHFFNEESIKAKAKRAYSNPAVYYGTRAKHLDEYFELDSARLFSPAQDSEAVAANYFQELMPVNLDTTKSRIHCVINELDSLKEDMLKLDDFDLSTSKDFYVDYLSRLGRTEEVVQKFITFNTDLLYILNLLLKLQESYDNIGLVGILSENDISKKEQLDKMVKEVINVLCYAEDVIIYEFCVQCKWKKHLKATSNHMFCFPLISGLSQEMSVLNQLNTIIKTVIKMNI